MSRSSNRIIHPCASVGFQPFQDTPVKLLTLAVCATTLLTSSFVASGMVHAQTPALDANTRALAAAAKAGDKNKIIELQHQRQAIMQAQSKLTGAAEATQKYRPQ